MSTQSRTYPHRWERDQLTSLLGLFMDLFYKGCRLDIFGRSQSGFSEISVDSTKSPHKPDHWTRYQPSNGRFDRHPATSLTFHR